MKDELINILVNYLKKFFELFKISKEFMNSTFIGSQTCCKIMKNFSKKINEFKNSKTEDLIETKSTEDATAIQKELLEVFHHD